MTTLLALLALVGSLNFGADAAITSWTTPVIAATAADGSGTLSISETQATGATITTYEAVTGASTITYAFETAVSPFSLSSTGVLTISSALVYATQSSYTFNIVATDDGSATGTATITVTVTENATPAFGQSTYTPCIITGSTAGTTLATTSATDSDSTTITHTINSGNTNTDFTIDGTTGVITVDTAKTLAMATTPTYTLVVYAKDGATNEKTGSTTVSVEVTADGNCSGAIAAYVSIMTILMALFVSM